MTDKTRPRLAILFDGALPDSKKEERLSRLAQSNQQVRQFRINYPTAACPIPSRLGSVAYSLLAPALRECLGDSGYASVTRTVPGEADDWCASLAKTTSHSIVFSDDSDLLLYGYPREGLIAFFKDVDLWPEPKMKCYSPSAICQNLNLQSLLPLAFRIQQDPHKDFTTLLKEAKTVDDRQSQYDTFRSRYVEDITTRTITIHRSDRQTALQHIDVRISEFAEQIEGRGVPAVYLPFLVEDANQSSAWNVGQDLRVLAYSLLATGHTKVYEHKRKAQVTSRQEIELQPLEETRAKAASLAHDFSGWLQWVADRRILHECVWPLIATILVLPELRSPPQISLLIRIMNSDFDNTWDFVHLTARIQAALYSLRFLKQCIAVWLATIQDNSKDVRQDINLLHRHLRSMPSIAELFIVPGQMRKSQGNPEILGELIREIYISAGIEVPVVHVSNKKKKKQQREAQRKERRRTGECTQQSSNRFELLD